MVTVAGGRSQTGCRGHMSARQIERLVRTRAQWREAGSRQTLDQSCRRNAGCALGRASQSGAQNRTVGEDQPQHGNYSAVEVRSPAVPLSSVLDA